MELSDLVDINILKSKISVWKEMINPNKDYSFLDSYANEICEFVIFDVKVHKRGLVGKKAIDINNTLAKLSEDEKAYVGLFVARAYVEFHTNTNIRKSAHKS